jgi:MFS transporter, Spinster family, sphingosine-1-phosphate transporter
MNSILFTMAPSSWCWRAATSWAASLGDAVQAHKQGPHYRLQRGRLMGAIFLFLAITTPIEERTQFFVLMCLTAIFMPLSSPNVIATVYDVTVPEVRSTAQATEYFIENAGAAFAPLLAGISPTPLT